MHSDVLVVGGGVIGTATAYYLTRAGFRVTLLERRGLASGASGANVGLVSLAAAAGKYELSYQSVQVFPDLAAELEYEIHYVRTGSLSFFHTPAQQEEMRARAEFWQAAGVLCRVLDGRQARGLEPVLSADIAGAVWEEFGGMVYPFALTMGFAAAATRRGARVEVGPGAGVTALRVERGRVTGVETPHGFRPAGAVVLATGAWGNDLTAGAGLNIPIIPVRGHVMVTERVPRMIHRVIFGGIPSARQTVFGNIIIGSLQEHAGYDQAVQVSTMRQFARGVLRYFPALRGLNVIRAWTGLRPATADGLPAIGWASGVQGLLLNLGHFANGICNAPASGRIVADLLSGQSTWPWAAAFDPGRFPAAFTA